MCDLPLSLCLVFYTFVLADGFAVFHGHLSLVGTHFFALPKIVEQEEKILYCQNTQMQTGDRGFSLAICCPSRSGHNKWVYMHACVCVREREPLTVHG